MIEMFIKVWPAMPKRVINTHEDGDHVWGNQLFEGAEIIAHRSVSERMKHVANPEEFQKLLHGVGHLLARQALQWVPQEKEFPRHLAWLRNCACSF
jgi:glyoxylase-like metal-dependent hydrolase (beta-lactamase superfamily II)